VKAVNHVADDMAKLNRAALPSIQDWSPVLAIHQAVHGSECFSGRGAFGVVRAMMDRPIGTGHRFSGGAL
jgi:hypothetical protein